MLPLTKNMKGIWVQCQLSVRPVIPCWFWVFGMGFPISCCDVVFCVHPYLGKIPNLTNIFQRGWNHQLVNQWFCRLRYIAGCPFRTPGSLQSIYNVTKKNGGSMKKNVGFRGSFWKKAEVQEKRRAQQQQQSLLDGKTRGTWHVLSYDETRWDLVHSMFSTS